MGVQTAAFAGAFDGFPLPVPSADVDLGDLAYQQRTRAARVSGALRGLPSYDCDNIAFADADLVLSSADSRRKADTLSTSSSCQFMRRPHAQQPAHSVPSAVDGCRSAETREGKVPGALPAVSDASVLSPVVADDGVPGFGFESVPAVPVELIRTSKWARVVVGSWRCKDVAVHPHCSRRPTTNLEKRRSTWQRFAVTWRQLGGNPCV